MRGSAAFPLPFVAILATLGLVCATLFGFVPSTPKGIQCPTAPVQAVFVRNCCGRLVARAPKPGERAFVQCRCAEKRAAAHDAVAPTKIDFFLATAEPAVETAPLPPVHEVPAFSAILCAVAFPPATRPPTPA